MTDHPASVTGADVRHMAERVWAESDRLREKVSDDPRGIEVAETVSDLTLAWAHLQTAATLIGDDIAGLVLPWAAEAES